MNYLVKWMSLMFAAFLITGATLAMALTLQQEMQKLRGPSAAVQRVAREAIATPNEITDAKLEGALANFDEIAATLERIKIHAPQDTQEHADPAAFREAFKSRIDALGNLFELLRVEFEEQRSREVERRDFTRAGRISAQIDACRTSSHNDFMTARPLAEHTPESCLFVE